MPATRLVLSITTGISTSNTVHTAAIMEYLNAYDTVTDAAVLAVGCQ